MGILHKKVVGPGPAAGVVLDFDGADFRTATRIEIASPSISFLALRQTAREPVE
jgi:hypothetical protein